MFFSFGKNENFCIRQMVLYLIVKSIPEAVRPLTVPGESGTVEAIGKDAVWSQHEPFRIRPG